jgi:hypothetical protein
VKTKLPIDKTLEVVVCGGNIGESIILRLPDGSYGVIDCYATTPGEPQTNRAIQWLKSRGINELAFVCLTHPHHDHYRGMLDFFVEFQAIREFWCPEALLPDQIKQIVRYSRAAQKANKALAAMNHAEELQSIFKKIAAKKRAGETVLRKCKVNTRMIPKNHQVDPLYQIWALSPSDTEIGKYNDTVGDCFDNGQIKEKLPGRQHNMISIAMLVTFGTTRIILGGDVEAENWAECSKHMGEETLKANFVKISHHASTTGYYPGQWMAHAAAGPPDAVFTTFGSRGLPEKEAIAEIRSSANAIYTPSLPDAVNVVADKWDATGLHPLTVALLGKAMQPCKLDWPISAAEFEFDNAGNLIRQTFEPNGGKF